MSAVSGRSLVPAGQVETVTPHHRISLSMRNMLRSCISICDSLSEIETIATGMTHKKPSIIDPMPSCELAYDILLDSVSMKTNCFRIGACAHSTLDMAKSASNPRKSSQETELKDQESQIKEKAPIGTPTRTLRIPKASRRVRALKSDEINETTVGHFVDRLAKCREVTSGKYHVANVGTEDLYAKYLQWDIAVLAQGRTTAGKIVNIGLAVFNGGSDHLVSNMLNRMCANKRVDSIDVYLAGGFEDTASPEGYLGEIMTQTKTVKKAVVKDTMLNPYGVDSSWRGHRHIVETIGYFLHASVTLDGFVNVGKQTLFTNYNDDYCSFYEMLLVVHDNPKECFAEIAKKFAGYPPSIIRDFIKSLDDIQASKAFPQGYDERVNANTEAFKAALLPYLDTIEIDPQDD